MNVPLQHCSRHAFRAATAALAGMIAAAPSLVYAQTPASLDLRDGELRLTVDDPRPLARAADLLQSRCQCPITYEDPAYTHTSDVVDVTVRPEFGRALIPRGGPLELTRIAAAEDTQPMRSLLQGLIAEHAARGYPGAFSVEETGAVTHLVPTAIRDRDGRLGQQRSPLDAVVSMPTGNQSGLEVINRVIQGGNATGGVRLVQGTLPMNLLTQLQVSLDTESLTARDALSRLVQSSKRPISWRMFYDPGWRMYVLNFQLIRP